MNIPTKLFCFNSRANRLTKSARKPAIRGVLAASAFGLAIALTACTSSPTADSPTANSPTTEQTATTPTSAESSQTASNSPADTKTYVEDGAAIGGADPVAYFTESAYVPGSPNYTYDWEGTTWQFSSPENRDLFAANPEQYAPEYGGFCAWAVAAKNVLVATDPNAWSIVDDKLYLNANQKVQSNWQKDVPRFIAQANDNWPSLSR